MYKTKLQELCHQQVWDLPVYTTVKDGLDHCPRFTSTVTVNGVPFQSPQNQCKSSKDAQNVAAKLALDYFSSSTTPPPPALSNSNVDARPAKNEIAAPSGHKDENKLKALSRCNVDARPAENEIATLSGHKDENRPKDLVYFYKNRLQQYLQKKGVALPEYSYEFDGPPHALRFKAIVLIDGRSYQSPEYYRTLKDAEHAAAKVALESLSLGDNEEDESLYKTLLQELALKEGFHYPSYSTIKTGPAHLPTFVSTVQVGLGIYHGRECKTKKQAEMNAAKVAYNVLLERRTINTPSPGCSTKEEIEFPSLNSQPIISDNCQQNIVADTSTEIYQEIAAVEKGQVNGKSYFISLGTDRTEWLGSSSSSLDSAVTNDLQHNMPLPTDKEHLDAEPIGGEPNAKRHRCSSPTENRHHHPPETFTPNVPSSCTMPSTLMESDAKKTAGGNNLPGSKVIVFRRGSNTEIPKGASILPCSNNEWVAARVELNENPQLY